MTTAATTTTNATANTTAPAITASTTDAEYRFLLDGAYELLHDKELLTLREGGMISESWDGTAVLNAFPSRKLVVGTHNGQAHADEALAIALLSLFSDITVVRTRDEAELEACDLRVDVGEGLLDHHGSRHVPGISAATRVWQLLHTYTDMSEFLNLVRRTAALDTGIEIPDKPFPWWHTMWKAMSRRGIQEDAIFMTLFERIREEVVAIAENARAEEEAKAAAEASIEAAGANARVIVFDSAAREADVKKMLWERKAPTIFYISPEDDEDWRILCCCPAEAEEYSYFASARLIPEKFRGLRGTDLDQATGLQGGIFCHAAGFIAGFKTREAAEAFANLCLQD